MNLNLWFDMLHICSVFSCFSGSTLKTTCKAHELCQTVMLCCSGHFHWVYVLRAFHIYMLEESLLSAHISRMSWTIETDVVKVLKHESCDTLHTSGEHDRVGSWRSRLTRRNSDVKTEREKETERHKPTLVNTYTDVQRYKARQKENENERERERELRRE